MKYSDVISIESSKIRDQISIINDATNQNLQIQSSSPIVKYTIYNISGQKMQSEVFSFEQNSYNIKAHSLLPGIYVINVEIRNGINKAIKMVIPF